VTVDSDVKRETMITKSITVKEDMTFYMPTFQLQFMKLVRSTGKGGEMDAWVTINLTKMSVTKRTRIYD